MQAGDGAPNECCSSLIGGWLKEAHWEEFGLEHPLEENQEPRVVLARLCSPSSIIKWGCLVVCSDQARWSYVRASNHF